MIVEFFFSVTILGDHNGKTPSYDSSMTQAQQFQRGQHRDKLA